MAAVVGDACIGCGACQGECPIGAIEVEGTAKVDADSCISCGSCVDACPVGAIEME